MEPRGKKYIVFGIIVAGQILPHKIGVSDLRFPNFQIQFRYTPNTMPIKDGLKRLAEKRSREAAQAQVTVTPADTIQHCSPCPLNPDMPPDVCFKLESNKGKMDPKLKELESSTAGTGLETPGQQYPPNEGAWETERTTADGFLTMGVGSNQGRNISLPT